jgi:hypothetical protein
MEEPNPQIVPVISAINARNKDTIKSPGLK